MEPYLRDLCWDMGMSSSEYLRLYLLHKGCVGLLQGLHKELFLPVNNIPSPFEQL